MTASGHSELVCVGGWPGNLGKTSAQVRRMLAGDLQEVARADVQRVDGVRRDPEVVTRLLRSLARNVATAVSTSRLRSDVRTPAPPSNTRC